MKLVIKINVIFGNLQLYRMSAKLQTSGCLLLSTALLLSDAYLMLDESQSTLTASSIIVTKPAYACFKVAASTLAISSSSVKCKQGLSNVQSATMVLHKLNLQLVQNQTFLRVNNSVIHSDHPMKHEHKTRPEHNTNNSMPSSLREVRGFFNIPCKP